MKFEKYPFIIWSDSAAGPQLGFQDPASPIMEGIINLHHYILYYIIGIIVFVSWIIIRILGTFTTEIYNKNIQNVGLTRVTKNILEFFRLTHSTILEIIWTIIPGILLFYIAIPSFALLYSMDEIMDPVITIKAIGHQWYWSYECKDQFLNNDDFLSFNFDSYMLHEDELQIGDLRLLEVDNPLFLPIQTLIRVIVTADDVLHCWAVPALGIKIDAVPGRLNQTSLYIKREGTYYGQCSEICGINHGFMPIVINAVSLEEYN